MRRTCEIWCEGDQQCGEPAVDYSESIYADPNGDRVWMCARHWDWFQRYWGWATT